VITSSTHAPNYTQQTTIQPRPNPSKSPAEGSGATKENSLEATLTLTEKGKAAAIQERMPFIEEMGEASSKVEIDKIIAKYSHLLHDNHSYKKYGVNILNGE